MPSQVRYSEPLVASLTLAAWVNRGPDRERYLTAAASVICDGGLLGDRAAFPSGDPSPAGRAMIEAVYATYGAPVCVSREDADADPDTPPPAERTPETVLRGMLTAYALAAVEAEAVVLGGDVDLMAKARMFNTQTDLANLRATFAEYRASGELMPWLFLHTDYEERLFGERPVDAPPRGGA